MTIITLTKNTSMYTQKDSSLFLILYKALCKIMSIHLWRNDITSIFNFIGTPGVPNIASFIITVCISKRFTNIKLLYTVSALQKKKGP